MTRTLVLYGTTDGHTAKVARLLTDTLWTHGIDADIVNAEQADPDPSEYAGVIVAASVHAQGYQRAVTRWVRAHAQELAGRPTAFVSVCLGVLQHEAKVDRELEAIMGRFLSATGWQPTERKIVAGALPYTRYNWIKRWAMRRIVKKAGGDLDTSRDYEYTDWRDLKAFAEQFARRVGQVAA